MALGTWEYIGIGAGVFFGGIFGLVLVPIYCWFTLFFSIPLLIVESFYAIVIGSVINFDLTGATNAFAFWILIGLIISIPFAMFMAIFGEIILIPSFLIGLPINIVVFILLSMLITSFFAVLI